MVIIGEKLKQDGHCETCGLPKYELIGCKRHGFSPKKEQRSKIGKYSGFSKHKKETPGLDLELPE